MIKINSQELRNAVQAAYEFDSKWGSCIDYGDSDTIGISGYEVFTFNDKVSVYYFRGEEVVGYEGVV